MFRANLQSWQRFLRLALGGVLLTWAAAGGAGWGYPLGLFLAATGAWGFSPSLVRKKRSRAYANR